MHVLVIDDDIDFCYLLSAGLSRNGYEVSTAHDGIQGQRIAGVGHTDVMTIDYQLPGGSGLVVLDRLRHNPVMLLSGFLTGQFTEPAEDAGVRRVLSKLTLTEETLVRLSNASPSGRKRRTSLTCLSPVSLGRKRAP